MTLHTASSIHVFPHLTIQVKNVTTETSAKPQVVHFDDAPTIAPNTTKTITASADHPSEWNSPYTLTPVGTLTEIATLLTFDSMSTFIDKKVALRVTHKGIALLNQKEYIN